MGGAGTEVVVEKGEYWKNRSQFSSEELERHREQWVAFSADGSRIVESCEDLDGLEDRLAALGQDAEEVIFERIGPAEIILGEALR